MLLDDADYQFLAVWSRTLLLRRLGILRGIIINQDFKASRRAASRNLIGNDSACALGNEKLGAVLADDIRRIGTNRPASSFAAAKARWRSATKQEIETPATTSKQT